MIKRSINTNDKKWKPNLQRSLHEQWTRIELMVSKLPDADHIDYRQLHDKHKQLINNINAIEEEWLVDPLQRAELSVLVFDEPDDGMDLDDLIDRAS